MLTNHQPSTINHINNQPHRRHYHLYRLCAHSGLCVRLHHRRYETLEFDAKLPHDVHYAPQLALSVWDHDSYSGNDYVSGLRLSLGDFTATTVR